MASILSSSMLASKRSFGSLTQTMARRAFSSTTRAQDLADLTLIGRLGNDIEIKESANGTKYARYSVAVGRRNGATSWFRLVAFDNQQGTKLAGLVEYYPKGTLVYVEADASISTYSGEENKSTTTLQLVQRRISKLASPRRSETETTEPEESYDAEAQQAAERGI